MTLEPADRALVDLSLAALRGDQDAVRAAVRMGRSAGLDRPSIEEALLQGALYFGFPRALTAFQSLNETWPGLAQPAARRSPSIPEQRARGEALFARIYDSKNDDVRSMLQALSPDLESFVIECAYGRILARPGLSLLRREVCATAVLAAMGQEPQLIGHARAAIRLGLEPERCAFVLRRAVSTESAVERLLSRIRGAR